jgi:hypothetical protein
MRRKNDTPTRGEVSEKVETSKEKMQEGIESLEVIAEDTETIRGTLENIEGGTAEGTDSVLSAITEAEDISVTKFGEEDSVLEEAQDQAEQYETEEIQESRDSVRSDVEKISDAAGKIETQEAATELKKANDAADDDINFLTEQAEISKAAREENEALQQQARSRVQGVKK